MMGFLPPTLQKLKEFDGYLGKEGLSLDEGIGLRWTDESMAYDQTPYDVLPFMDAGVDGIHVGLLTDFGKVTDLEEAFVVCVHPMNAPDSLKILACNPKEFVDYLYSDRNLTMFFNFMMIESEEQYRSMVEEGETDFEESAEFAEAQNLVLTKMKEYMGCKKVGSIYEFVESAAEARRKQIVLPTKDGIGIAGEIGSGEELPVYPVDENADIGVAEAQGFLASAPLVSKLAFIRDAQYAGLIDNQTPLKGVILSELESLGYAAEVARLKSLDW